MSDLVPVDGIRALTGRRVRELLPNIENRWSALRRYRVHR